MTKELGSGYFLEVRENAEGCWDFIVSCVTKFVASDDGHQMTVSGRRRLLCGQIYKNVLGLVGEHSGLFPNKFVYFETPEELKQALVAQAKRVGFRGSGTTAEEAAGDFVEALLRRHGMMSTSL